MAVRWLYIQTVVVWGASLGGLDSIWRWADIEALVQFDQSIDRSIESFVVFAGWLFEQSSSGSGNGRLVLATVLSCLSACLLACLPACLCQCLIQFGGGVGPIEGSLWPFAGCTFERWSSGVPP